MYIFAYYREAKLFAEKMASGFTDSGNQPATGDLETFKNMAGEIFGNVAFKLCIA